MGRERFCTYESGGGVMRTCTAFTSRLNGPKKGKTMYNISRSDVNVFSTTIPFNCTNSRRLKSKEEHDYSPIGEAAGNQPSNDVDSTASIYRSTVLAS